MILKRVADTCLPGRGAFPPRIATLVRPFVAFRVAVAILAWPSGLAAQAADAAAPPAVAAPAPAAQLGEIFRSQAQSGAYALPAATRELAYYPMLAAMSWDTYQATGDRALLSQAAYSIGRHYSYLLSAADRDGDRLLESRAPWGAADDRVEDPGFNALAAVDMQRLARLNIELRRTMAALYWYDTARILARAVVSRTFDPDASYFFPADAVNGTFARHVSPVSALPVLFDGMVGSNISESVVARQVVPWIPDLAQNPTRTSDAAARAVERLVAVNVLRDTGHDTDARALLAGGHSGQASGDAVAIFADARAMRDEPLVDRTVALDIFFTVVRACGRFRDVDVVRLQGSLAEIAALAYGSRTPDSAETGDRAVRDVYTAVSRLREQLGASNFWNSSDRSAFPGKDPTIAARRLTEDVLLAVRRAENRLFTVRFGGGVNVATAISSNAAVEGDDVLFRWEIATTRGPLGIKSLQAGVLGESMTPVNVEVATLTPDAGPLRFAVRHPIRAGTRALRTVTFVITLEDASGVKGRRYDERSVFVEPPMTVVARFPRGRIMDSRTVPLEITVARNNRSSGAAKYFWFSPGGLRLAEGNQGSFQFSKNDSLRVTLNVEVPTPCRPGVFPFTLKFMAGDRDAGVISSSLFRPYQWTAIGPFPAKAGLESKLPPESGIGLLQSYAGADGMLNWKPVPVDASGPSGEVHVNRVIEGRGVSYLYTVVGCANETDIEARLAANCQAALIVNGQRVLTVGATSDSASSVVHLNADRNHILVKFVGDAQSLVGLTLGGDDNLATDEFNNDLMELAEGYRELVARVNAGTGPPAEAHRLVTFRLVDPGAASVALVGSFNGWSPQNHRMRKRDGKVWEITLSLAPGRYSYRFLVDQKKQVLDPSTRLTEPDGFGGQNSVVIVSR